MPNDFDIAAGDVLAHEQDPLTRAVSDTLDEQRTALRSSLYGALMTNPDMRARAVNIGRQTGVPADVVERNLPDVQRAAQLNEYDRAVAESPKLAEWLSDPNNAKLAHDDANPLAMIERVTRAAAAGATFDFSSGAYGTLETVLKTVAPALDWTAGTLLPENPLRRVAAGYEEWRKNQQAMASKVAGDQSGAGAIESGVVSGFRSFGQMAAPLAASVATGNPAIALGTAGVLQGSQSATKALDEGHSPAHALLYGTMDATAEVATEMLPVGRLLKDLKANAGFWKIFAHQVATDAPTEMAATAWQNFNEWAMLHPEKTAREYLDALPGDEAQTIIATLTTSLLTAGLGHGVNATVNRLRERERKAQDAEQGAAVIGQLQQAAQASKLQARDVETFQQFVAHAAEDGPVSDVYVSAQTLAQSGIADKLAEVSPSIAEQLPTALETGADVRIPVDEFTARVAPTEYAQGLLDHLKTDPEGMSRAEAKQYIEQHGEELRAEVEHVLAEHTADSTFIESRDKVQAQIQQELDTTGRFTPAVNAQYAAMVGNFYAVTAAKMGVSPEEVFSQYPLSVRAQNIATIAQQAPGSLKSLFQKIVGQESGIVSGMTAKQGSGDNLTGQPPEPESEFNDLESLAELVKKSKEDIFVRWSSGGDMSPDIVSRDYVAGGLHSGLSAVQLSRDMSISDIAKYVKEYGFLRMKNPDIRPRIYEGNTVGTDSDGYPSIRPSRYVGTLSDSLISSLDSGLDRKLKLQEIIADSEERLRKTTDNIGRKIIQDRLEKAKSELDSLSLHPNPSQRTQGAGYEQPGGNRGAFNPETLNITLLKDADLSTFLHETGHFFLEVQVDLATKMELRRDSLTENERQILNDTYAVLRWFGVKDLDEWHSLDIDARRPHHEQFARGFEAYLFEGKPPAIELQGLFQRFRAWLLNVYKSMQSLDVQLSDEVRGVFDRMLASNEQIKTAEFARSMLPLFDSPQSAGMTPEEFAAYHAEGQDATQEALRQLQTRGLRDMQWLANARGRELKRLQKEAASKRREARIAVRREVMAQPVYQAWQFLTRKLSDADKLAPPPANDPNVVDPSRDSMLTAIAKLGGMNKQEAVATLGMDPAEKPNSGVFGKPVFRREGGDTPDGMASRLIQYGYLSADEHGKADAREFEEKFFNELRGVPQYSNEYDYDAVNAQPGQDVRTALAGRLDRPSLVEIYGATNAPWLSLDARHMVASRGVHPDIVAEMFGFSSGDELIKALAAADPPAGVIEALTDKRMLEEHGDLADDAAMQRAADRAVHNDVRARFVATELTALENALNARAPAGKDRLGRNRTVAVLPRAARQFAEATIARLKVRNVQPGQYAAAEVRAAKAADKALKAGNTATAMAEKRNQLINLYATKTAYTAREEVEKTLRYFKKFDNAGVRKKLDVDYLDQIDALLERVDLRAQTLKVIDKRASLAAWIKAQRDAGFEPDIPPELENEAFRTSYKNMTVEEFRGLRDTIAQIEHLARLKHKLLTAADQRAYEAVRDEIALSIEANAGGRSADTRTPTTNLGRAAQSLKRFWASHIKAATWARILDGGHDGGPVWEYLVRSANVRGDHEATMRADATARLSEILAPVFKLGRMGGAGEYFPTIQRSLNREARLAIALNVGNDGNLQRLLGGEGWTLNQVQPVLDSLTREEWDAVQAIWGHFESYKPQIAAKERRIYGKEPAWVEPREVATKFGTLRGGYYPIKYDPAASQRAEEHADAENARRQLQGAYTSATTRRSFTKARVDEIIGRPLLYSMAGVYSGVNDVIHDLAWHEWLIDTNRLLRSSTIDSAIRSHYGPHVKDQFKAWVADVAEGGRGVENAGEMVLGRLRQGVSAAGLGFNVVSAAMQITGFNQSVVRVGAPWIARGVAQYVAHPIRATRGVNALSEFMRNRMRTRFRELNELRNRVQDETPLHAAIQNGTYFLLTRVQQTVDVPTWLGAYEKAMAEGNDEARAVSLADQAVVDAQGSGQIKDLSAIERGGPALKLFTVFYGFMNTAFNLGATQTMTAKSKAKLAADYLLLFSVPPVLGYALKSALIPDGGDDSDDWEKIAKRLLAEQIDYLMGLMVVVREFAEAAKTLTGANDLGRDYTGPAGLRFISDLTRLTQQANQGEFDDAFRKAAVNTVGDFTGLPAAQINRTITGVGALNEGQTDNPAAVVFGYRKQD